MTEPDAWEPTELERKLLEAAKGDRIPPELGLRIASTLSISSTTAASAVAHGGLLFSKSGLWGVLSVALLAGAGALYTAGSTPQVAATASAAPSVATVAVAPDVQAPARQPAAAAPIEGATVIAAPAAATKRDAAGALHAEINVLDRARQALETNAPEQAYRLLDQHRRRFAQGTLIPEAEALRIEALVRLGDSDRARRMTQRFLTAYPAHPLCERVSALVATAATHAESNTSPSRATPAH
jgi:hypothetical protein